DNGGIGSILYMSATNHLGSSSPDRPLTDWFIDPARSGGGCVRDHIVHAVDLCRWFSGSEPVEVYAEAGHLAVPHLPVEDTAILIVRLANGIVFTIDPSWNRPRTWTRWGDVTVRVVGSDGAIEGDLTAQAISRTVDTARWVSYDEDMNEYLLRDFASAILEGRQPLVSGADGRAGVATTLAAYESIRTMAPARIL
ncbi:MAG: Gfo/Idh/MocA family oxidoreductase, partial [Chloroflexi bacterium]|nr:Gfo/Idh/MocA family oxidoreductase [Chloroflexota bacterium]